MRASDPPQKKAAAATKAAPERVLLIKRVDIIIIERGYPAPCLY
jgi:hypothetical protein